MRQLSLFDVPPGPQQAAIAPNWEAAVPASAHNSSNRHWSLIVAPAEPRTVLLAVLSVQWDDPDTGHAVIFVPHTGARFTGQDYLRDVYAPFHGELASIARLHGIGAHRAAPSIAWRLETRTVVHGDPFAVGRTT